MGEGIQWEYRGKLITYDRFLNKWWVEFGKAVYYQSLKEAEAGIDDAYKEAFTPIPVLYRTHRVMHDEDRQVLGSYRSYYPGKVTSPADRDGEEFWVAVQNTDKGEVCPTQARRNLLVADTPENRERFELSADLERRAFDLERRANVLLNQLDPAELDSPLDNPERAYTEKAKEGEDV